MEMTLVNNIYDYVGKPSEGLIRVKIGKIAQFKCGFIDLAEKVIVPLIYTNVRDFKEGKAAVRIGNWAMGKCGFINHKGELIIPCIFDKVYSFSDGIAKVIYNKKWYFIDTNGTFVIALDSFVSCSDFKNGIATIKQKIEGNIHTVTIDKTGNVVTDLSKYQVSKNSLSHSYWTSEMLEELYHLK